jgi:hypothetical protein
MEQNLPFVFDLFFDIKTRDQLVLELAWPAMRVRDIRSLMADHAVEITAEQLDLAISNAFSS